MNSHWPLPPIEFPLEQDNVHVWSITLAESADTLAHLNGVLSPDELRRANAFHFERDRNRYVVGRATVRTILGRYLGMAPEALELEVGPNGKPKLAGAAAESGLQFNLAHSENLAVFALAYDRSIGIDLERLRPMEDALDIAACFCSASELARFKSVRLEERDAAFFRIWTRKEAWLKATGAGIGHLLQSVEVSFDADDDARFVKLPEVAGFSTGPWSLRVFNPADGFLAALAAPGAVGGISCWQWRKRESMEYEYS